ncbi:MAG: hypothetical protein PHR25_00665 [Clostridia bacterium]|nr:hypothetical protein [Clostridia bacterium]
MKPRRSVRREAYNNKWKIICLILFVVFIYACYEVVIISKYTMGKQVTKEQMRLYNFVKNKTNSK